MKKRLVIALLAGMVVLATGCTKKEEKKEEPIQTEQEQTDVSQENQEEPIQGESEENTSMKEVAAGEDSTEIFPESGGILELPLGLEVNGEIVQACTVKAPADYIIAGNGYDKNGQQDATLMDGETLKKYFESGDLNEENVTYAIAGLDDVAIRYEIYTTEMGGIEVEKENSPDGVDVGTEEIPGYGYMDTNTVADGRTPFCTAIQLNDDIIVILRYGGPEVENLEMQEMAEKLYGLITPTV